MSRSLTFAEAVNDAYVSAMSTDQNVIAYGLGTDDPKGVFGTTLGLKERFGPERVFDMPCAENGMTGIAIGAALEGIRPVMCHQRLDFFLLAMDQLVNNAAKWHYMFGGQDSVPITIRLILGRGWGQGPTHSQNLQAWFNHIPGLKVVMPATAADARGLLLSSIFDENPVIFLEHRWLHNQSGQVPEGDVRIPLGKATQLRRGDDVTIVAFSYMAVEAVHAADFLADQGVGCELIDPRTVCPLDKEAIAASVAKTGRLLVLDTGHLTGSVARDITAWVCTDHFDALKQAPQILALPDQPTPTSFELTKSYYHRAEDIVALVGQMMGRQLDGSELAARRNHLHDVPGDWFKGPF